MVGDRRTCVKVIGKSGYISLAAVFGPGFWIGWSNCALKNGPKPATFFGILIGHDSSRNLF